MDGERSRQEDSLRRQGPPDPRELGYYFSLAQVGTEMVLPLVVGAWVDHAFGCKPWATLAGVAIGFIGGLVHLIVLVHRHDTADLAKPPGGRGGQAVRRLLGFFVGGSLIFWLLLVYPAWLLGGESGVVFSSVAGLLCLLPTAVTLCWCLAAARETPEQRLIAVLGGTGIRLVVVLGAGMALFHALPYFHYRTFWIWVIVFYLFTLTLEVSLLLTCPPAMDRSEQP